MLVNSIEETFNEIWQVSSSRSIYRSFTNYLAAFFVFPIFIVVTTGFSIVLTTIASSMPDVLMLDSLVRFLFDKLPYVLLSALFIGLYVSMPNTHVEWRCAVVPGIIAGVGIQWLQLFYVHSQIWVTGYNAIYGSFAALPLFMLWVQISWALCLFGAQLTYTNQNMKRLGFNIEGTDIHPFVEMGDDERDDQSVAVYSDGIDGL
jgi:membrane protein